MEELIDVIKEHKTGGGNSGIKEFSLPIKIITNHSPYDRQMVCCEQEIDNTHSLLTVTDFMEEIILNNYDLKADGTYDVLEYEDTFKGLKGNLICIYTESYNTSGGPMFGVISFNGRIGTFYPSSKGTEDYYGGINIISCSGVLKKCPSDDFEQ